MTNSKWHVGMRNVKTTLAVAICIIVYWYVDRPGGLILACIAAIVSMQSTIEEAMSESVKRIAGTLFGGILGAVLVSINSVHTGRIINLLAAALGTMLIIFLCNLLGYPQIISMSLVVFLIVVFDPSLTHPFSYAMNRVLDSGIGIAISVVINLIIRKPKPIEAAPPIAPAEAAEQAEIAQQQPPD